MQLFNEFEKIVKEEKQNQKIPLIAGVQITEESHRLNEINTWNAENEYG